MCAGPLYILGSSGHAREIAAYAEAISPGRLLFFVDDRGVGENCITVREYSQRVEEGDGESVIGAGRCEVRRWMLMEIRPPYATVIHPAAIVMGAIGPGSVAAPCLCRMPAGK